MTSESIPSSLSCLLTSVNRVTSTRTKEEISQNIYIHLESRTNADVPAQNLMGFNICQLTCFCLILIWYWCVKPYALGKSCSGAFYYHVKDEMLSLNSL